MGCRSAVETEAGDVGVLMWCPGARSARGWHRERGTRPSLPCPAGQDWYCSQSIEARHLGWKWEVVCNVDKTLSLGTRDGRAVEEQPWKLHRLGTWEMEQRHRGRVDTGTRNDWIDRLTDDGSTSSELAVDKRLPVNLVTSLVQRPFFGPVVN